MTVAVTYRRQMTEWWSLQPDLQFIRHPGRHVPPPNDLLSNRAIPDAPVAGLRSAILF